MKGKLALCSRGCLGIITHNETQEVEYGDSVKGIAYVGIHLRDSKFAKAGDLWSSRMPKVLEGVTLQNFETTTYQTFEEAIDLVKDARAFQAKAWPNTELANAGGRPFEEWVLLLHHYMTKLDEVYTTTPGNLPTVVDADGRGREYRPNVEGRKRVRKYAAIIANLAVWAVQSALGSAYSD